MLVVTVSVSPDLSSAFFVSVMFVPAKAAPEILTVPAKINPAKNVLCFTILFPSF
jgi:hypothetical protein